MDSNSDSIELHFEVTGNIGSKNDDKKYKVIKVKLNDSIRLSKYALKKVLVKKSLFEIYPTLDKFLK